MDSVYRESEMHSSPQKTQNMLSTHHSMVCYNCFKKLKNMRVPPQAKKTKEKELYLLATLAYLKFLNFTSRSFWECLKYKCLWQVKTC